MDTNYGPRPGIEKVTPRTMSAEQEAAMRACTDRMHRVAFAELDAERAVGAELLAALGEILATSGWRTRERLDEASRRERETTTWEIADIAERAIAKARGERGAK